MKKSYCRLMVCILFILAFILLYDGISSNKSVYAASKPAIKEKSATLYVNYKDYKIEFNNLSKDAVVTYKSANDAIAKVTKTGYIKPLAEGKAVITATIKQNKQSYTSSISVTVKKPYINITNAITEIEANSDYIFKAKAMGFDNANFSWSSSNEQVGVINSKSGKFTAIMVGKTKIQVKDLNSGKEKSFNLEVIGEEEPDTSGLDISIINDEVVIQGLIEEKDDVIIPDLIGGYPVTQIGSWSFYGSDIKSIKFGKNIKYIGEYAFFCSEKLTKALLNEGIEELAAHSFDGCRSLVEFNIPDSVKIIGDYAFDGCSSLLDIKVNNSIERTIGKHLFNNVALSNPVIAYKHNVLFNLNEKDQEEIDLVLKALDEMNIKETDSDVEKVKKVHDWIIYNVMWEKKENDIIKIKNATGASNLMIALKYHIAVCEHYMVAFQTFMEMLDVENKNVYNVKENHGWNMVKLDGDWYMIDVGHDGPNGWLLYRNFLFNSSDPYVDWGDLHTYDKSKYPIVNGTKYTNYVDRELALEIEDVYENLDLAAEYR